MVFTMVSARTYGRVAQSVFDYLRYRFSCWEQLAQTSPRNLERLIRRITFPEKYARYIPDALRQIIRDRGELDLDFLDSWPVMLAVDWLEKLPGVGAKTSAAILNFSSLHKPILVVDTAHQRVAERLGLIPQNIGQDRASRMLGRQVPDHWSADDMEEHHVLMQQLGQTYCYDKRPACNACPLQRMCSYATFKSLSYRHNNPPTNYPSSWTVGATFHNKKAGHLNNVYDKHAS